MSRKTELIHAIKNGLVQTLRCRTNPQTPTQPQTEVVTNLPKSTHPSFSITVIVTDPTYLFIDIKVVLLVQIYVVLVIE